MNAELLGLLDECRALGVTLALENGRVRARGAEQALTPTLRAALGTHRDALTALLRARDDGSTLDQPVHRARTGDQPMSSAQQRLWFVTELAPASSIAYNIVAAVRIEGRLRSDVLEQALAHIVRRHDTLRASFVAVDGRPVQRSDAGATLSLRRCDVSGSVADIDQLLLREGRTAFDLRVAPLVRGTLARVSDDDHVLVLVLHHLVSDGWSSGILIAEVAALYDALAGGGQPALPPLTVQYADYVEWQDTRRRPGEAEDLAFWTRTLQGVPTLNLPADHPRPPIQRYAGTSIGFRLPRALADRLHELSRREGATLFITLLAAFNVLLCRYSGQTDIAVGTTTVNRSRRSLEPIVGLFTNMLAMRTDLSGQPSFTALLARVREAAHAAYAHQDVSFDRIVDAVQPERVLSQNPLFQVCFSLLQAHRDALRLGDLTITQLDPPSPASRFDLTLTMEDASDGLRGAFEFNSDLFEPETIVRLIEHWEVLLDSIAAEASRSIADLPLLRAPERQRLLVDWNDSTTAYPRERTVHELFAEQAALTPDAVALRAGDRLLTYRELDERANRLAHTLRDRGVGPDVAVAIAARRSIEMVVGLVAILKAGGYYVPFDPTDPAERLAFVFRQVRPAVLLTGSSGVSALAGHGIEIVALDTIGSDAASDVQQSTAPPNHAHPDNLAYTTYTSGSTGVPKGICIPHRGVVRLIRDTNYMRFDPSLVFLEIAPVSFDASTFEIWGALLTGAQLVIMPPDVPSLRELASAIERYGVTTLYLTSALFSLMVDERLNAFAGVKHLLVGGDIISAPHARKLLSATPGLTLINGYGPTETTTFASCGIMASPGDVGYTVTIGRAISNTTLHVLDGRFNPTPIGVPGDLYIAGDGNARGYLNLPALTAATFVPNPYGAPGDRMYRTGDLARYLADGTLEFLGRRDHQVKIRGFRIELGEIENVLTAIAGVSEAIVLVDEVRAGDKRLVAFVQPAQGSAAGASVSEATCVAVLRGKLPDYMIPSAFVFVASLPLTPHSKVDRAALRAQVPDAGGAQFVAPSDPLEQVIAGVWQDVLGVERVGVTDNFFACGGHSLLATQVMWRVFEIFGVEVPLRRLFEAPTVADFAVALAAADDTPGRIARVAAIYARVQALSDDEVARELTGRNEQPQDQ